MYYTIRYLLTKITKHVNIKIINIVLRESLFNGRSFTVECYGFLFKSYFIFVSIKTCFTLIWHL